MCLFLPIRIDIINIADVALLLACGVLDVKVAVLAQRPQHSLDPCSAGRTGRLINAMMHPIRSHVHVTSLSEARVDQLAHGSA